MRREWAHYNRQRIHLKQMEALQTRAKDKPTPPAFLELCFIRELEFLLLLTIRWQ